MYNEGERDTANMCEKSAETGSQVHPEVFTTLPF